MDLHASHLERAGIKGAKAAQARLFLVAIALACFACGTKADPASNGDEHADAGSLATGGQPHSAQSSGGTDGADSASGASTLNSNGGTAPAPVDERPAPKPEDVGLKRPSGGEQAALRDFIAGHPSPSRTAAPSSSMLPPSTAATPTPHAGSAPAFGSPQKLLDLSTCTNTTLVSDHPTATFLTTGQYAVRGQTIVWSAASNCAQTPEYQFHLFSPDGVWTIPQDWGTSADFHWDTTGLPLGFYSLQVWVRGGSSGSYSGYTQREIQVNDAAVCTSVAVTSDNPAKYVVKGGHIHWSASAACTGTVRYQYYLQSPAGGSYVLARDWSTDPTFDWDTTGLPSGWWNLIVWATNVSFYDGWGQAYGWSSPIVNDWAACTGATLTSDDADSYAVPGQQVTWTATSTCAGPAEYEFWFQDPNGVYTLVQGWSSSNTFSWNTTNQPLGYWNMQVWVRDAPFYNYEQWYGWHAFILNSSQPCLAIASTPSASTIAAGTPVTLHTTVQQCTTSEFEIWHLSPGGAWAVLSAYAAANANYIWDTTGAPVGLHTFQIRTRTQGSPQAYQTYASFYVNVLAGTEIPTSAPLVQDFNALGSGALDTLPTGWLIDKQASPRTVGTFGQARTQTEFASGASVAATAPNGIYNFGSGVADPQSSSYWQTSLDRAPGWLSDGADLTTGGTKSGNLYVALRAPADKDLTALDVGFDVEKYRKGTNAFRVQLFSSADGTTWTNAGNTFQRTFAPDAAYSATNPAPDTALTVAPARLTASIPSGKPFYLAWNYTVDPPTSNDGSNAQALAVDNVSIKGDVDNPGGSGGAGGAGGPSHCQNGVVDQGESDVDCGGSCGPCVAGKMCHANSDCALADTCHAAATCDSASGICSNGAALDKVGCNINLRFDGVVDAGNGTFVAVFGHDSTSTTSFHPASNAVFLDGIAVATPQPEPPAYLPPGQHPGSFLPTFNAGQSISWTVDGQTVSASQASTQLTKTPIGGSGYGVNIGGTLVALKGDLEPYLTPPAEPGQAVDPAAGLSEFPGTLTGELSVSPSGAAVYKVPIALAPGVAGMAPNLALVYSSQGGPGIAGQGWDLTGLSMIHRCALTRAEDGFAHPVTMTGPAPGEDGICLDGKRLFDRGARSDGTGERYEPELSDFSDITLSPDPLSSDGSTITVVTKSGETRYYGMDDTARVRLPGFLADSPTSNGYTTAIWLLQKVVDVWGNYYEVVYNDDKSDFENSGIVLSQIKYTGHLAGSAAGNQVRTEPFQIVRFGYEPRPDVRQGRLRSGIVPRTQRLKTIDTGIGVYQLDYVQPATPPTPDDQMLPSRLQTINYCPATGACVRPLSFDWDGGGYGWVERPGYKLPVSIDRFSGSHFMDLNGDGRTDVVSQPGNSAWFNNGTTFEQKPAWALPGYIWQVEADTTPGNTMFADLDGDGLLDAMHIAVPPNSGPECPASAGHCVSGQIWISLNRIRTSGEWAPARIAVPSSADWANFVRFGAFGALADMNGDGRADLVAMGIAGHEHEMRVLINTGVDDTGNIVWQDPGNIYGGITPIEDYELRDVNRDGFPDLVGKLDKPSAGNTYLHTGTVLPGHTTVWTRFELGPIPGDLPNDMQSTADFDGDGLYDVLQYGCRSPYSGNAPAFPQCEQSASGPQNILFTEQITMSTGLGYDIVAGADARLAALAGFTPPKNDQRFRLEDYAFIPVDVNADGLSDLVQRKLDLYGYADPAPGRLLFNTGKTFVDLTGATSWHDPLGNVPPVPRVPRQNRESGDPNTTFLDLDGDGVTDLASTSMAWQNTFQPPVIRAFPNGLATKSVPNYKVITTAEGQSDASLPGHPTYADTSLSVAPGSSLMMTPLRVVASIAVDDGIGGTAKTDYEYRDLRTSPIGRGPQGFGTTIMTGPEDTTQPVEHRTRIATTTQYLQAFPYTALPSKTTHDLVDSSTGSKLATISVTSTDYCDAMPGTAQSCTLPGADPSTLVTGITRFTRPTTVIDLASNLSSSALTSGGGSATSTTPVQIISTFKHDKQGNPIETTVQTVVGEESYEKKVVNVYGAPDSAEERLGKVTLSTATTRRVAPQDCLGVLITHTTQFEYGEVSRFSSPVIDGVTVGTLGLKKTIVEPGLGVPSELHTAYEYDGFGNVVKTTSCASEFDSCGKPGAHGPIELPYRITQVSYDPADFGVPSGTGRFVSLAYGPGRYPVKTTNAAGHSELTAYDARFGTLLQQTGPNGVSTCNEYDGLGRQMFEIGRCGSASELITRIQRLSPADAEFGPLKVVTATTPPTGSPTWSYTDALGRPTMSLTRAFDSQYVKALTVYDDLGRAFITTKPFLSTSADFSLTGALTTLTHYDALARVVSVSDELGLLDGIAIGSTSRTSTTTTTYEGSTITTRRTVNGEARTHSETKNALGKLSSATDANGVTISFTYDADGNLTDTAAPADVCNPPAATVSNVTHIKYDARGRKQQTFDPDLGAWSYQYNGFGDLVGQTDAKGGSTNMDYDTLGRMIRRDDDSGTSRWIYDAAPHGVGKLAAMVGPSDARLGGTCQPEFAPAPPAGEKHAGRSYHYTAFGDVEEATDCADGNTFVTTYGYDRFGRANLMRYPEVNGERFAVNYSYTSAGYLRYVADAADGQLLWAAKAMNAAGQVTDEILRNGVETESVRNNATGWLLGRKSTAHADGETVIQDFAHAFDEAGNLRARQRTDGVNAADSSETFGYDALDRLLTTDVQIAAQGYHAVESYTYDALGNLQTKAGKTYKYTGCLAGERAAGPHAVCQIDSGPSYNYDANGNLTSVGERTVAWNAANKATRLTSGAGNTTQTADFIYGADGQRVVQVVGSPGNSTAARTVYVGLGATGKSVYERTTRGTTVEHAHFIYAGTAHGGSAFAIRMVTENASTPTPITEYQYHHFDHLSSVTAVSDSRGHVTSAAWAGPAATIFGYDAWGARRSPDGRAADPATFESPKGNRGFTDQETIPSLGLVNMNGRIYDPAVGRFLSPDPTVQFASNLQSYNHYSYAADNPLRYTDPTGYNFWEDGLGGLVDFGIGAVAIAACWGSAGAGCALGFALAAATVNTTAAIASGAPWDSAVGAGAISVGVSAVGIAAAYGEEISPLGKVSLRTAIAGFMTPFSGGDLGPNMVNAAFRASFAVAGAAAGSRENEVSQRSELGRPDLRVPNRFRLCGTGLCLAGGGADDDPGIVEPGYPEVDTGEILAPIPAGETELPVEPIQTMPFVDELSESPEALADDPVHHQCINLASPERTVHILYGDAYGGGHLWPGLQGKTPFPEDWAATALMERISDVATDPSLNWVQQTGPQGSLFTRGGDPARFSVMGDYLGFQFKVILEPAGEGIITAFGVK
ncbi:MAG: RHS repeat-associated core domain-containing protein [Polyangiaceae bacterium]